MKSKIYMENPLLLFQSWYQEELNQSTVTIPSACCLSSVGLDGFPNARFVSLKEIIDDCFVVTGPLNSRKGKEIQINPKVALTFWWTATERQVRIQGEANPIGSVLADQYFSTRNTASKVVSLVSEQGAIIDNLDQLVLSHKTKMKEFDQQEIPRPKAWGGFLINPIRIELMEFKTTRFHVRQLFEKNGSQWKSAYLQP